MSATSSRTNLMIHKSRISKPKPVKDLEFTASVNEHGIALFEHIPIACYKVKVPEF